MYLYINKKLSVYKKIYIFIFFLKMYIFVVYIKSLKIYVFWNTDINMRDKKLKNLCLVKNEKPPDFN